MNASTDLEATTDKASTWLCSELQAESCVEVTLQLLTNTSLATTQSWTKFALQSSALIGPKPPQLTCSTNQKARNSLCWGAGSQLGPGQFSFRWIQTRADVCSHGGHPLTQPLSTSHPNQTKTITTHFALCFPHCQKLTPFLFHFFRAIKTFLAGSLSAKVFFAVALTKFQKVMVFQAGSWLADIFVKFSDIILGSFGPNGTLPVTFWMVTLLETSWSILRMILFSHTPVFLTRSGCTPSQRWNGSPGNLIQFLGQYFLKLFMCHVERYRVMKINPYVVFRARKLHRRPSENVVPIRQKDVLGHGCASSIWWLLHWIVAWDALIMLLPFKATVVEHWAEWKSKCWLQTSIGAL